MYPTARTPTSPSPRPRRSRRTYLCGPCKRYKMKCNLEVPCQLCVLAKRDDECLAHPPNPPLAEERTKIEKRKNRNVRRTTARAQQGYSPRHRTSPQTMLLPSLSVLLATADTTPPDLFRGHLGTNVHDFVFLQEHAAERRAVGVVVPVVVAQQALRVLHTFDAAVLAQWFARYRDWDKLNVHELLDYTGMFAAAAKVPTIVDAWTCDAYSLQQLLLVCAVLAFGHVMLGRVAAAREALLLSHELRLLAAPVLLADYVHYGTWVLMWKAPYNFLNEHARYAALVHEYLVLLSQCDDAVAVLHQTQPAQPDSEQFLALARVWTLFKIAETEIAVFHLQGLMQFAFSTLQHTIQPDADTLRRVYGFPRKPPHVFTPFNYTMFCLLRFFRRFESAQAPQDFIFRYLTLYLEIAAALQPRVDAMLDECVPPSPQAVARHALTLGSALINNYMSVRWLSLVRADAPHFPSMRFAHYVSLLICCFNWPNYVADHCDGATAYVLDAIATGSHTDTVVHTYKVFPLQALFLAVLAQFDPHLAPDLTVSLDYLYRAVHALFAKTLPRWRDVRPYCDIPVVAATIGVADALLKFAETPAVHATLPHELSDMIAAALGPECWANLICILFGVVENFNNHTAQLWRLVQYIRDNGQKPIPVTWHILLDTEFFLRYESAFAPFSFTATDVEEYMACAVLQAL